MLTFLIKIGIAVAGWYLMIFICCLIGKEIVQNAEASAVMTAVTAWAYMYLAKGVPIAGSVIITALATAAELALILHTEKKMEAAEDDKELNEQDRKVYALFALNGVIFSVLLVKFLVHYNILN